MSLKCTNIDAVLFTHEHSDHTSGLPDIRAMSLINKSIIPAYMSNNIKDYMINNYKYIFKGLKDYAPFMTAHNIEKSFSIDETNIETFKHNHGSIDVQTYRINNFAYSTDIKNFYEIRILIDFVIIKNDIYLNYIGEDFASNDNIINRYDYTMTNTGYLENRNQIKNNMKQIVDGYYRKYYNIIGYDSPPLDYGHYISKLDTIYKFNIGDLTKYYVLSSYP